jgi:membrane protease YdiL (CAAX protease family)
MLNWVRARVEIVVPALGLLILRAMLTWQDVQLSGWQSVLIYATAVLYAALVLWSPMTLPAKQPQPITRQAVKQAAVRAGLLALGGFAILTLLSLTEGAAADNGRLGLGSALAALLLITVLGTAGLAAEHRLPLDLFPLLRRRELKRVVYVLAAALFLAALVQMWSGVWSGLAAGIGRAAGETQPDIAQAAAGFAADQPLRLFLNFLIGAGLFEELLFRVGIMTPVWAWTRRWGWGLLVSAVAFGLYHISPPSPLWSTATPPSPSTCTSNCGTRRATCSSRPPAFPPPWR